MSAPIAEARRTAMLGSQSFESSAFAKQLDTEIGAAELRMKPDGTPDLWVCAEAHDMRGLRRSQNNAYVINVLRARRHPRVGSHPTQVLMQMVFNGAVSVEDLQFNLRALGMFGASVAAARSGTPVVTEDTFAHYDRRLIDDPVTVAHLYRTVVGQPGHKPVYFESRYGIHPTAIVSIGCEKVRYLGIFGVPKHGIETKLKIFDQHLVLVRTLTFRDQFVFTAATIIEQGCVLFAAETDGRIQLFEMSVRTLQDIKIVPVNAGDVRELFRIVMCFGQFVGFKRNGDAVQFKRVRDGIYEQQPIFRLPDGAYPRAFHRDSARLVVDLPEGVAFSPVIERLEDGASTTLRGRDASE